MTRLLLSITCILLSVSQGHSQSPSHFERAMDMYHTNTSVCRSLDTVRSELMDPNLELQVDDLLQLVNLTDSICTYVDGVWEQIVEMETIGA